MARLAGSASLVLVDGATPLRPELALFDATIEGWCRQYFAWRLSPTIIRPRVRVVQRFRAFTGAWPWEWTAAQADAWVSQASWALRRCGTTQARWRFSSLAILATAGQRSA